MSTNLIACLRLGGGRPSHKSFRLFLRPCFLPGSGVGGERSEGVDWPCWGEDEKNARR